MNIFRWITPQFAAAIATLVLLLSPFVVWAAKTTMEAKDAEGGLITLWATPCLNDKIMAMVPSPYREQLHQGLYTDPAGKEYSMCWALIGNSVGMQYEDGDQGRLPMMVFKPKPDA